MIEYKQSRPTLKITDFCEDRNLCFIKQKTCDIICKLADWLAEITEFYEILNNIKIIVTQILDYIHMVFSLDDG